jgi:methylase of polypeptide subunit release factors
MLGDRTVARLRAALDSAEFRVSQVEELLGTPAHQALARNETVPALLATGGGTTLETLTRLWLLQTPVFRGALDAALPGLVDELVDNRMLEASGDQVRALVDVRPYGVDSDDWWVVSDLTPGLDGRPVTLAEDHVLGVSSASTTLAQLTVRRSVGSALDLGTGAGIQALHLASHAAHVVATDVNERALTLADLTWRLNGAARVDRRLGSLFEPVQGESFDLIVSNPPFVVSPGDGRLLTYRDSGLPGDEMVRRVVTGGRDHLADDGVLQVLANWVQIDGEPWEERLRSWLGDCDAWVIQREALDPAEYVELWLKDAGLHPSAGGDVMAYRQRYDAWLQWFDAHRVRGVGLGWITLRRTGRATPDVRLEEWPYEVEQPLGPEVAAWTERADLLGAMSDDEMLDHPWMRRSDVRQETVGVPGEADPETIVLRQQRGMRRAVQVDTVDAGLVGASDGELTARQLLHALAELLGAEAEQLVSGRAARLRSLVADGFLEERPR